MVRSGMKREVQIIAEWNGDMNKQNEVVTEEWDRKRMLPAGFHALMMILRSLGLVLIVRITSANWSTPCPL